jgi:hypothetical protein
MPKKRGKAASLSIMESWESGSRWITQNRCQTKRCCLDQLPPFSQGDGISKTAIFLAEALVSSEERQFFGLKG